MPSDVLNFNKPCSACRRRKVRCDKAQPCNNCVRHGVSCVYEAPRESAMSQQLLQDRVERLERMVEDMAAFSLPSSAPRLSHRSSCSSGNSNSHSPFSSSDESPADVPADAGAQVFRPASSYFMGPDSWMSIDQFANESCHLLNVSFDDAGESEQQQQQSWPLTPTNSKPKDLTHLHLPQYKEDVLINLFFDHIEPFIRTCHHGSYWQLVTDYRQGIGTSNREVEALIFATQYITATVLPKSLIEGQLGVSRAELSCHLQRATELALDRANLMRSRNTILFNALLYYITCQFHTGNCEVGSTLLGLAGNIARRIGLHKDPAYYGYAAWIVEMRRRMWGQLAALDAQAAHLDGSESILLALGDVQRSHNASDADWTPPSGLLGTAGTDPGSPEDREGFSDATVPLMRLELSRACHSLSEARRTTASCEDLVALVDETERYLRRKFLCHFDGSDPMQLVITHWANAWIRSLHVSVLYFHASPSKLKLQCHVFEQLQNQLYEDCLACLEELERGEKAALPHHWHWAFRWPMPIHCVAGLLSGLARQPDHRDSERAWQQVDVVFQRYNNEDLSMARFPAWTSIESLCDEAMLKHPNRVHEGRAYAARIYAASHMSIPHASPVTTTNPAWESSLKGSTSTTTTAAGPGSGGDGSAGMPAYSANNSLHHHGMCSTSLFDHAAAALAQPTLSQMFSAEALNLGFSASDIDTIFFNLNEHNEFPSIDI